MKNMSFLLGKKGEQHGIDKEEGSSVGKEER